MTLQEALQLRERFYRCATTTEEERALVGLLLSNECPEELLADRHAIITLAREEALPTSNQAPLSDQNVIPSGDVASRQTQLENEAGAGLRFLRRIAAAFVGIVLAGGLTLAAIHLISPSQSSQQLRQSGGNSIATSKAENDAQQPVFFENVRLDSVLAAVAAHYGCTVSFMAEEPLRLRLSTTWQPTHPLSDFINLMNELDGLHLTTKGDTIYVNNK